MAVDKLVDSTQLDSDLTDVADEIRTAGGTLLPLSFPDDYVVAIGDIGNTEIKTASGSIAHFEDALARKAQDLTVAVEPVQSGSGDPAPDNVRPISGWTECKVTRTGRNLLDTKNYAPSATTSSGITIVQNQDGSFKVSGTATGVVNLWLRGAWGGTNPVLKLYAGKTYFIKDCTLYNGKSMIGSAVNMGQTGTYTPSADIEVTGVRASTPNGTTLDTTIYPYVTDSADTEWQPFGDTYSITFPSSAGTVYGGTLDVTTGKLTVTHASDALTGQETIVESTNTNGFFMIGSNQNYALINKYAIPNAGPYPVPVCSHYKGIPYEPAATAPYGICNTFMGNNGKTIGFKTTFDGVSEFQSYIAAQNTNGTPVRFVLPLMTPKTYDLTPVEVTTLLGTNNVWADTGDSTVQYIAPKAQIPSASGVYF